MKNPTKTIVFSRKIVVLGRFDGATASHCGRGQSAFMGKTFPHLSMFLAPPQKKKNKKRWILLISRMVISHIHIGIVYAPSKFIIRLSRFLTSS